MSVCTNIVLKEGTSIEKIIQALKNKYQNVQLERIDSDFFRVRFADKEDHKILYVSFSNTCKRDDNITGVWCSLDKWGRSIEIGKYLCEIFGGKSF